MVPIGGRPILWHVMKIFSFYGYHDFVLCLGYRGDQIRSYFANYSVMNSDLRIHIGGERVELLQSLHDESDWTVTLVETGETTPTGGRIRRAAPYLEGDRFLATYGDGLANVDVRALVDFHQSHGKLATVTGVHPTSRFGELRVRNGLVAEFREKPKLAGEWVSGGFFVFERAALERIGVDDLLEAAPLERLAAEGQLMMYAHDGYWQSMDTLRDVRSLNEQWNSGQAPWRVWTR
jgi:glucose-1-phosphate cytidylyltransferase